MPIERSPFLELERSQVVSYLRSAGSRDPDLLHTRKTRLLSLARFPKRAGTSAMILGALCTLLVIPAFIGVPLLVLGWRMRRRGMRNVEAVELGWAEFSGTSRATA